jgi:fucose 4-O-acetylase-like acetyltransferase
MLLSGFFFILGNEVRQVTSEKSFSPVWLLIGTGIGLLALNFLFLFSVDIAKRVYESFFVNTAEALLGILFILALSRQIELYTGRFASLFKYLGNISLIILLFHVPIQGFWGQKVLTLTNSFPLSIVVGFIMGVLGPILIYEIFIRFNPIASFWFGRPAEQKQLPIPEERMVASPANTSVAEIKE